MASILVIDVGTSSMRGALYNEHGQMQEMFKASHSPEYLGDNRVEQNPSCWEDGLIHLTRVAVEWVQARGFSIEAVSVTSQRSSAIPVDRSGNPLHNAIMWQDKRTRDICNELSPHAAAIYERTGLRINPIFAAPKFSWFKRREPGVYAKVYKFLVIPDFLIFLMTGKFVTDYTYGSRTLLMNLRTLDWDEDLLRLFDIDREKLCELTPQGSVVSCTTDEFKNRTGLRTGTPVISAGGDQQCAALGAGVIEDGRLQVTTGTGSFVIASSGCLQLDPLMRILCGISAVPGKFVLESSILTTSGVYAWFNNIFYQRGEKESSSFLRVGQDATSSPAGSNGVMALTHFQGRGSPDWNALATGTFFNVTLGTTRGDFARSILEGIAAEIAENIDIMREYVGEISTILVAGGLTQLSLFNQIQSDMYNQQVFLPGNKEATSLGAWVSATVTLGMHPSYQIALNVANTGLERAVYSPIRANVEVYKNLRIRKECLYRGLEQRGIYRLFCDDEAAAMRFE